MNRSLVFRLTACVALINVLAVAALIVTIHRTTSSQFQSNQERVLVQLVDEGLKRGTVAGLETVYAEDGVSGMQALADEPVEFALPSGLRFIVVNTALDIISATDERYMQADVTRSESGALTIIARQRDGGREDDIEMTFYDPRNLQGPDGELFGQVVVFPDEFDEEAGVTFALNIWRSAALLLAVVVVLAVAATALLLRWALSPIDRLTAAAASLKQGQRPAALDARQGSGEFEEVLATFNAAALAIADTEEIRKRLISDIAHELRTPVTNIKGQLEALDAGLIRSDAELVSTLTAEARVLERLAEDFQQIAVSDAGQIRLNLQPLPLAEVIDNVLEPMCHKHGASVKNEMPHDIQVYADEERFRQVLTNLFDNAARHRPEGLVIRLAGTSGETHFSFVFEDNGPGVSPDQQPYIFERFYRGEKSRNRATGGAGLGLTIVQGLMNAMGGSVAYTGSSLGGAGFALSLPLAGDLIRS